MTVRGRLRAFRAGLLLVTLVAASVAIRGITSHASASSSKTPRVVSAPSAGPATLTDIAAFAQHAAAVDGDSHPVGIQAVRTTEDAAMRLMYPGEASVPGATVDTSPVYLVTMHGRFTAYNAPYGIGKPPRGSVYTFTVSAATGQIRDINLSDRAPELQKAGAVVRLPTP
jgi:hypothetical protein